VRKLIEELESLHEAGDGWKRHGSGARAWWTMSQPWGYYIVRSLGGGEKPKWAAIYEPAKPGRGELGKGGCVDSSGKVPGKHVDHPDVKAARAAVAKHIQNVKDLAVSKGTKAKDSPDGGGVAKIAKKKTKEKAEGDKIDDATRDAEGQLKALKEKGKGVSAGDLEKARGIQKAADAASEPTYASSGEMPGPGGKGVQALGKARSWLAKLAAKLGEFIKGVADRRTERKKNED